VCAGANDSAKIGKLSPCFARRKTVQQFFHVPLSANTAIFEILRRFISVIRRRCDAKNLVEELLGANPRKIRMLDDRLQRHCHLGGDCRRLEHLLALSLEPGHSGHDPFASPAQHRIDAAGFPAHTRRMGTLL
jgi:hypothetical protein